MVRREVFLLWRERVDAWQASGLNIRDYCSQQGIPLRSFHRWKPYIKTHPNGYDGIEDCGAGGDSIASDAGAQQWVQCTLVESLDKSTVAPSSSHLTIRVCGAEIDVRPGCDYTLLRSVIQALGVQPC